MCARDKSAAASKRGGEKSLHSQTLWSLPGSPASQSALHVGVLQSRAATVDKFPPHPPPAPHPGAAERREHTRGELMRPTPEADHTQKVGEMQGWALDWGWNIYSRHAVSIQS